jgi:hypothetical protein
LRALRDKIILRVIASEISELSDSADRTMIAAAVHADTFCSDVIEAGFPVLKIIRTSFDLDFRR